MLDMQVVGLTVDNAKMPAAVLQDASGEEILSISIGALEAVTLSLTMDSNAPQRAIPHDLLLTILKSQGISLLAVEITALRQGVYAANLVLTKDNMAQRVDCRPSDGMTLALRAAVPLRVHRQVLRDAAAARLHPENARAPEATTLQAPTAGIPGLRQTATPSLGNNDAEDRQLEDLLKKLEPESSRKM